MPFTSPGFYAFVLAVWLLAALPVHRLRLWLLVGASYLFYGAAEPWYCGLLLFSTLVDFTAARRIHTAAESAVRRRWLWLSVGVNLVLLGMFKYADFTLDNLRWLLGAEWDARLPHLDLLLPVGISFYTFQTMSYTIDVYRGRQRPTRDFAAFALYVAFFPQLVAGPIERARNLLAQFERPFRASREDVEYGVQRILWGIFKKVVFADRFALLVAPVYLRPEAYSSPEVLLATLCFSFQLYLDFSAYTDIAIGLARLFGIRLSENFNYPFLARNPSDFWSRWHITLTSWFRDYLYGALGGTRRQALGRSMLAILLTLSLMGLWHGAAWHFVVFGLLSGVMVVIYLLIRLLSGRRRVLGDTLVATVFSILLMNVVIHGIMVFFRAPTVQAALDVFTRIGAGVGGMRPEFYLPSVMLLLVIAWHVLAGIAKQRLHERSLPTPLRGLLWALLFLAINTFALDSVEQFIYFRF